MLRTAAWRTGGVSGRLVNTSLVASDRSSPRLRGGGWVPLLDDERSFRATDIDQFERAHADGKLAANERVRQARPCGRVAVKRLSR